VLTHLLLEELKKSAQEEDGDARVVVVTSSLHDVEQSKKRGRELSLLDSLSRLNNHRQQTSPPVPHSGELNQTLGHFIFG